MPISAQRGFGFEALLARLQVALEEDARFISVRLSVPFARTDLVDLFHRTGRVEQSRFDESGTTIFGQIPAAAVGRFSPYLVVLQNDQSPAQPPLAATTILSPESAA